MYDKQEAVHEMDPFESHHFDLTLNDVFRSLAHYSTDQDGNKQLRFNPPVYTQRYSSVLNILKHDRFKDEIKKVQWTACERSPNRDSTQFYCRILRLSNLDAPI